jgi:Ca-activated chloride channel family protein
LAGSELADILNDDPGRTDDLVDDLRRDTGISLKVEYSGSLVGADRITRQGGGYDLAWFASDTYLSAATSFEKRPELIRESVSIMSSPVVLGIRHTVARELGWGDRSVIPWETLRDAAADRKFQYALAAPFESNSGFSTLWAASTHFGETGDRPWVHMANLLKAESSLRASSTRFLADQLQKQPEQANAIFTYESEVERLGDDFITVYPKSTVYADYPIVRLGNDKTAAFARLTGWLRQAEVQERIQAQTLRRPVVENVQRDERLTIEPVKVDLPSTFDDINAVIDRFLQGSGRPPSRTIYLIDASKSMTNDEKQQSLCAAFTSLTGNDPSVSGLFTRFRPAEKVTVFPFAGQAPPPQDFVIPDPQTDTQVLRAIRNAVCDVVHSDNTPLYGSVLAAYERLQREPLDEGYITRIVLITDGESTEKEDGDPVFDLSTFDTKWREGDFKALGAPLLTVGIVGTGDRSEKKEFLDELARLAEFTGGRTFDPVEPAQITELFKEIRGYV